MTSSKISILILSLFFGLAIWSCEGLICYSCNNCVNSGENVKECDGFADVCGLLFSAQKDVDHPPALATSRGCMTPEEVKYLGGKIGHCHQIKSNKKFSETIHLCFCMTDKCNGGIFDNDSIREDVAAGRIAHGNVKSPQKILILATSILAFTFYAKFKA